LGLTGGKIKPDMAGGLDGCRQFAQMPHYMEIMGILYRLSFLNAHQKTRRLKAGTSSSG
jgi:hypothetical protein